MAGSISAGFERMTRRSVRNGWVGGSLRFDFAVGWKGRLLRRSPVSDSLAPGCGGRKRPYSWLPRGSLARILRCPRSWLRASEPRRCMDLETRRDEDGTDHDRGRMDRRPHAPSEDRQLSPGPAARIGGMRSVFRTIHVEPGLEVSDRSSDAPLRRIRRSSSVSSARPRAPSHSITQTSPPSSTGASIKGGTTSTSNR